MRSMPASSAVPLDDVEALDFDQVDDERRARHAHARRHRRQQQIGLLVTFFFGVTCGIAGLAILQSYTGLGLPFWAQSASASGGSVAPVIPAVSGNPTPIAIAPQAPPASAGPIDMSQVPIRESVTKGPANAPVVIFEYSDFQCPFCRRAWQTTNPQIFEKYVATGKVRFIYKHYAILGQESFWAAQASECAADQGRFWEFHDELFKRAGEAGGENVGAFNKDKLLQYAEGLKFDMNRFTPCLQNDETLARVQADTQEGRGFGVSGTPTFFINGTALVGAQGWEVFETAIETALKSP
jgi:protein-disulfide isomerase